MTEPNDAMNLPMSRRRFLRGASLTCAGALLFGLTGCAGNSSSQQASPASGEGSSPAASSSLASETSASATAGTVASQLIVVFSRAGENYGVGVVETGNTMKVAEAIRRQTGAEIFDLVPVDPYPEGYEDTLARAQSEMGSDARPELMALPDISGYERIYLGFPIWYGDAPMPFYTALEGLDWSGKQIAPFNTHAGSGDAGMFSKLSNLCVGATVLEGLSISGATAQNNPAETSEEVKSWIASLPSA